MAPRGVAVKCGPRERLCRRKRACRRRGENRKELRAKYDKVVENPTPANIKEYEEARRKKGTGADKDILEM